MKIILGSTSPRRKEILGYFTVPFEVVGSQFDEENILFEGDPKAYVEKLALGKGAAFTGSDALVITADTVVFCQGEIFNKPKNKEEAFKSLTTLAGRWHSVFTAISVRYKDKVVTETEETRVLFHPITPLQANHYQKAVGSFDKAGGYAIQGVGHILVKEIEGCYTNVMGLPLTTLQKLLKKFSIDLWNYLND